MVNQNVQELKMKQVKQGKGMGWALNLSPAKMAVFMTLIIFVAELGVMLLLDRLPTFSPWTEAIVDSSFLIVFLVPAYIAFYRPFWQARQQAQNVIQQLNHRLTVATEDERRRIALDLHDHCDQTLVALQRTVELVQGKVIDTSEEAAALCQEIDELLGRLNSDVRSVSSALHPPQLAEQGLSAALKQHVIQQQSGHVGITIEYIEKGDPRPIEKQMAISIYRIVQEALKNAIQHADATLIRVYIEFTAKTVVVSVVDNGKGFDPKNGSQSDCLGLVGMRERAKAFGSSLLIHTEKGRGTSLRATFQV